MRKEAQAWALEAYRSALAGVLGAIDARIQWRWDNAHMLALRAQRMAHLLAHAPGRIAARDLRVRFWKARERKHTAKAWAQNAVEAQACRLCQLS